MKQHASAARAAARAHQAAIRQDPRPRIHAPLLDAPWLPEIEVLNEIIGAVEATMPPSRDIDDDAIWVRKLAIPGAHAFTNANEPEEGEDE